MVIYGGYLRFWPASGIHDPHPSQYKPNLVSLRGTPAYFYIAKGNRSIKDSIIERLPWACP
jgi:hypothetical protein